MSAAAPVVETAINEAARTIAVAFPRNRIIPRLAESPTWSLGGGLKVRLIRLAPSSALPVTPGTTLKLLRGETTEFPTPLAANRACRSCIMPEYIADIKAGHEGAVMLSSWRDAAAAAAADSEAPSAELGFVPADDQADGEAGRLQVSRTLIVSEGPEHLCKITFYAADGAVTRAKRRLDSGPVFGEVNVTLDGHLDLAWTLNGGTDAAAPRVLSVPSGFEHGPFYHVDCCGHLTLLPSGNLKYDETQWVFEKAPRSVVASVHVPVEHASQAGPHRHCYT